MMISGTRYAWRHGLEFDRRSWIRFAGWITVFYAVAVGLIAMRYLHHVHVNGLRVELYLLTAFIGHFGFLTALYGLVVLALAVLLPSRIVILPASSFLMLAGLTLLALDTIVYDQYRFHLNGFVWKLLTGPGAGEIFHFSRLSFLAISISLLLLTLVVMLGINLAAWLSRRRRAGKFGRWVFLCWLTSVLISQSMHLWFEARYDAAIAGITRHFPLYYPVTAKRALVDLGWLDPDSVRDLQLAKLDGRDEHLAYPIAPLSCQPPKPPKNVLVVVIDAMRSDAFTAEIMPQLYALSERDDAMFFKDHFSGGNATKSGIFSLIYGVSSLYWDAFAEAGAGAEWIRQHQTAGYRIGVFSSSTLQSPAFDRTVFASVRKLRLTSQGESASDRDRSSINELRRFIGEGSSADPWFGFLFLDSAHSYDVPTGYIKFKPHWANVDHVLLNNDFDPRPYVNRYRNALGFLDDIVGQLIEGLDRQDQLQNTVVVLTSDHGEEFNDLGQNYWGHGSNFFQYQLKVPLLILWPGKTRQTFYHRTSHFDVAPTLMREILGCTNPFSDYSMGKSLFDTTNKRDWLLVHSYFNYGVVTSDRVITTYPVGGYDVHDPDGQRIDGSLLDPQTQADILHESTRFYRR